MAQKSRSIVTCVKTNVNDLRCALHDTNCIETIEPHFLASWYAGLKYTQLFLCLNNVLEALRVSFY